MGTSTKRQLTDWTITSPVAESTGQPLIPNPTPPCAKYETAVFCFALFCLGFKIRET